MSEIPTVLLLGGTGKVASSIAPLLKQHGHQALIASRKGTAPPGFQGCRFDWQDSASYGPVFEAAPNITSVFIVAPNVLDVVTPMKAFIDFARTKDVKRFVLLSATVFEAGGPAMGQIHQYLKDLKVEFAVLRPSWFMENFSEMNNVRFSVEKGEVYSATGEGKIPWISVKDIAAVAYHALTDVVSHNTDHILLGPELLSYADVAQALSQVLGKTVKHVDLTEKEIIGRFCDAGLGKEYAAVLGSLDEALRQGAEERMNTVVQDIIGQPPRTFQNYAATSKSDWVQ